MRSFELFLVSYLLNSIWQVPLLFAAGWLAAQALRPAGVAAEHRVWVSAGLLQGLIPACPLLPWSCLHSFTDWLHASAAQSHISVTMGPGLVLHSLRVPAGLYAAAAMAYGVAVAYFAARLLWRVWSLAALRRKTREVSLSGSAAQCWELCSRRFGVPSASIAMSLRVFGPVTVGLRHKTVLLPASMASGSPDLPTVIAHEFAHMQRNDFAKNLLYELVLLPVSYHPLCSLTRQWINESREMVCDQMAAEVNGQREYARSLLRLASLLLQQTPVNAPHAIGLLDANTLERRLMRLLKETEKVRTMPRVAMVGICALAGVAACGSALAFGMRVDAPAALADTGASGTAAPAKVNVPGGVMAGNVATRVDPVYPEAAKKAGVQGTVVLDAVIDREGTISDLQVVSGPSELRQSALDAVHQWRYKPYLLNGEPVEVKTTINITYSLAK